MLKRFIPLLKSYLWLVVIAAVIQGVSLLLINIAAIDGLPYLYTGVLYIVVATGLIAAFLFWRKLASDMNLILLTFACVVNVSYFALIPTIVDRSISVFVMNQLASGPKTKEQLEKAFVDDFVYKGGAVPKRIFEQSLSGNIVKLDDGSYQLTGSGHRTVGLFRSLGKLYNTDQVSIKE
jgi:predicted membrane protein